MQEGMTIRTKKTLNTEDLMNCVIRKPGCPTGLVGEVFSLELLMQSLGATNRRLLDTLRQMS